MFGRTVARTLAVAALGIGLIFAGAPAAIAHPPRDGVADLIQLPDGFQPEGIAISTRGTGYVGSLADGDIYVFNVRTGEPITILEGPGTPSAGLKIDKRGRLFIAGGPTGEARVIDASTGALLGTFALAPAPSFINDVVLTRDAAWFGDSQRAQLYKLPLGHRGALPEADAVKTVPLTGEWMQQQGFNANGIAQTPDHRALLVVQSATGLLFRVDPGTGEARTVDLGGVALTNGDGLLVVGRTLYVVQNQLNTVAVFRLNAAGTAGQLVDRLTDPDFQVPTTIAKYGKGFYLPNARFDTTPTPTTEYSVVRIRR
ncbi:SMP-30/gluconolactonase/LRE family protein [Mycetocola zhadangensis]|uniref:SMP-30/gluconolactonase/LRE family protein n=1 Tax=Mycetocola zhadangensis TaxID=1164595 RepID=UPI003A4DD105